MGAKSPSPVPPPAESKGTAIAAGVAAGVVAAGVAGGGSSPLQTNLYAVRVKVLFAELVRAFGRNTSTTHSSGAAVASQPTGETPNAACVAVRLLQQRCLSHAEYKTIRPEWKQVRFLLAAVLGRWAAGVQLGVLTTAPTDL